MVFQTAADGCLHFPGDSLAGDSPWGMYGFVAEPGTWVSLDFGKTDSGSALEILPDRRLSSFVR